MKRPPPGVPTPAAAPTPTYGNDQQFRALIEHSADAVAMIREDGTVLYASPSTTRLLGYTPKELLGHSVFDFIHPEDLGAEQTALSRLLARLEVSLTTECRCRHKDGSWRVLEATGSNLLHEPGVNAVVINYRDITADRQAREEIRFQAHMLSQVNDAVLAMDNDDRVIFANPAAERLYGLSPAEMLGRPLDEISRGEWVRTEDRVPALAWPNASGVWRGEANHTRRGTNARMRLDIVVSPTTNAAGQPTGRVAVIRDITERKRTEDALRESESRFRAALDNAPFDFWVRDQQGSCLMENAAAREHWGDQIGKNPEESGQSDDIRVRWLANNQQALSGQIVTGEVEYTQNLETRWYQQVVAPFRVEGRIRGIIGYNLDITERKRAEEQLRRLNDELEMRVQQRTADLRQANARLQAEIVERQHIQAALQQSSAEVHDLYNNAPCGYHSLDQDGVVIRMNDTELRWLGYSREEVVGRIKVAELLTPESLTRFQQYFPRLKEQGWVNDIEITVVRKDRTTFPILLNASVVKDAAGNFVMTRAIVYDLTERKELEREVLESGFSERRRIGQDLHDSLCQQLIGIRMLTKSLEHQLTNRSAARASEAAAIDRLLGDTIEQARRLAVGLCPVELEANDLVTALRQLAASAAGMFNVNCVLECHEPVIVPNSNTALHLYRIAQEAVANAVRHGQPKHVWINCVESPDQITLTVRDDGIGLPEKFSETPGMGLRIMNYRARMIGGLLEMQPHPPHGAVVRCTVAKLPA